MHRRELPHVPFVEAFHKHGKHKPSVIHLEVSNTTSEAGAAFATASVLHRLSPVKKSYHYVVDSSTVYRGVYDHLQSYYQVDPEKGVVSIKLCAPWKKNYSAWFEPQPYQTLENAANLVAELMVAHRIPATNLDTDTLGSWRKWKRRSRGGLYVSTKGAWPYDAFLIMVKKKIKEKTHGG